MSIIEPWPTTPVYDWRRAAMAEAERDERDRQHAARWADPAPRLADIVAPHTPEARALCQHMTRFGGTPMPCEHT
jgi:hypothetical protein